MKRQSWKLAALVAGLLTAAAGQSKPGDLIAQIPFPFVVADRTLPPGRYLVTRIGETNLRIYSSSEQTALVQTHRVQGLAPEGSGRMVFHRYGNVYFLSEVWQAANDIGQQLTKSRGEAERGRTETRREIAVLRF